MENLAQLASIILQGDTARVQERLAQLPDKVIISEEVLEAAAKSEWGGARIMEMLLHKKGAEIVITEKVVTVAAGNESIGKEIMSILFKYHGVDVAVTEEVLKAAAKNRGSGEAVMKLLLEQGGTGMIITEEIMKATAINWKSGGAAMRLLLKERGSEAMMIGGVAKVAIENRQAMARIEIKQGYKDASTSNDTMAAPETYFGDMRTGDQISGLAKDSLDISTIIDSVGDHQYLPVVEYITDSSEEFDEFGCNIPVVEPTPTEVAESTSPPAVKFRLSEMNEDLLYPMRYKTKLRGLQTHVWNESAIGQQDLRAGIQEDEPSLTLDSQLQESLGILACIQHNIAFLRNSGFCNSYATILQIDPARTQVALVRLVDLDKVARLGKCIDNTNTSSENLTQLMLGCIDLLGELWFSLGSDSAIFGLQVLDLVLVTHVYSHVGGFNGAVIKDTSTTQIFRISDRVSRVVTDPGKLEKGIIRFCRRTLKCLNGFLNGEQVWVLHGYDTDPMDSTKLWLSTAPDAFADIWGPMWAVTNRGRPNEILRYDLEHGSVVPAGPTSRSRECLVEATSTEDICHWISNNELRELEKNSDFASLPQITQPQLLIGAGVHNVTENTACSCDLTNVKRHFESSRFLRVPGSLPGRWVTDSKTVGTTAGGASVGAPAIQYSHTMKNTRVPIKEAFYKRWKNGSPDLRPWSCLLL